MSSYDIIACSNDVTISGPSRACPGATYWYEDVGNMNPVYTRWECTNCKLWDSVNQIWVTTLETSLEIEGYVFEGINVKFDLGKSSASVFLRGENLNTWDEDTKTVTLGPPSVTAATINGSNFLANCNSVTNSYSLTNISSGWSLNDWTVQSPLLTSSETLTSVNVSSTSTTAYGTKNLTAIMEYAEQGFTCGTQNISKSIYYGIPSYHSKKVDGNTYTAGYQICPGNHWVSLEWNGPITSYSWTVQSGITYSPSQTECDFTLPSGVSSVSLNASATNTCGTSYNASFYLSACSGGYMMTLYPNPSSNDLNINVEKTDTTTTNNNVLIAESSSFEKTNVKPVVFDLKIFDDNKNLVYEAENIVSPFQINNLSLRNGLYVVNVFVEDYILRDQIIIN